ncbi:hypothetical protein XELAEV_18008402mg [Xenopus laevis]|uniref:Uncharacterized protein n=1 Tax=Xenopus laevis TaxID=8355 RepID=A0A974E3M6_XENLA|nr:hypothetical protein XELAEV_18008402mg [Xenopus laevis]
MGCICCSLIIKVEIMRHPTQCTPIKMRHYATCDTENVIYLLKCPCGKGHFNAANHNMRQYLLQREGFWIKRLDTSHPQGMNGSWSVQCYL